MPFKHGLLVGALIGLTGIVVHVMAQGPPAQVSSPQAGQAPRPGRQRPAAYPAQQRPLADSAVIARGETLYQINCRACHGADLRGGDVGGPNLLRSPRALADEDGESIGPVIQNGLPNMAPLPMSSGNAKAVAAYVRSVLASAERQGSPPAGKPVKLDLLVGDAAAGQTYFAERCSSCHSPTGDLMAIGSRFPEVMELQNRWVSGGGGGRGGRGRGGAGPSTWDPIVTVTLPSGEQVEGRLGRIDDFLVTLTLTDGTYRSFGRRGDVPRVEIRDPLDAHKQQLLVYSDADIHNVTAYLVTLK